MSRERVKRLRALARPLLRLAFRPEVQGLEAVRHQQALYIANHNIGAAVEILILLDAFERLGEQPAVSGLAHEFAFRTPGLKYLVEGMGGVPATYESARRVLRSGASLFIFPGGNVEAARPFSQRHQSDFAGHRGWARIAIEAGVPVIPVSITGSHSVNPVLWRSRRLSRWLVIPKRVRVDHFPVSLSQLVWAALGAWALGPLGAFAGFVFTPLVPILPAKVRVRVGNPIDPRGLSVDELYEQGSRAVQEGMEALQGAGVTERT